MADFEQMAKAAPEVLRVEGLSVSFRMYGGEGVEFSCGRSTRGEAEGVANAGENSGIPRRLLGGEGVGAAAGALEHGQVATIHDLNLNVNRGELVAVVGASGSGKTLLADSVLGMFEPNSLVEGNIYFNGQLMDAEGLAALRGRGISLVPQSVQSLDPLMKVGRQVCGPRKRGMSRQDMAARRAKQEVLFERYGLEVQVAQMYPHELSGGMARRVLLCCALIDEPQLIVADEPTPGLDLPLAVQALADLRQFADDGGAVLLITHDIELALQVADRIAVFKAGSVVEELSAADFAAAQNFADPFTQALWDAMPEHGFHENMEMEKLV